MEKANHIGLAGRVSLRYKFPKTTVALSFQRYTTNGAGVFAGAQTNAAHLDLRRPLSRVWDIFGNVGYSRNSRLQLAGSTVNANIFSASFAGVGLHRQFGPNLRAFVSYQYNYLSFDTPVCPTGSISSGGLCFNFGNPTPFATAGRISQRQVGSIGIDWTPRPIRLD
jgi:hypothetical protein